MPVLSRALEAPAADRYLNDPSVPSLDLWKRSDSGRVHRAIGARQPPAEGAADARDRAHRSGSLAHSTNTDSALDQPVAANSPDHQFEVMAPNEVLATDITCKHTREG